MSVVPISQFAEIIGKNKRSALRIVNLNKKMKRKIKGVREVHVDLEMWEKIKKSA